MEFIGLILPVLAFIALIIIVSCGYVKAPPDMEYLISGLRKKPRVLVGEAGIKIPFLERIDKLSLGAFQIDVKTKSPVPTAELPVSDTPHGSPPNHSDRSCAGKRCS